jgi:dTDP-4-dehydrorhamnose reductase
MIDADDLEMTRRRLADLSFDVAINCVAATRVDDCEHDSQPAVNANAHFAALVAQLCDARGARLVQISTDYVFGGQAKRTPLGVDDPRAPVNVYGATKSLGEDLARMNHEDTLIVRVASLFGAAGVGGKGGNFVETIIKAVKTRDRLQVIDDQWMSPTSAHDAAETIFSLLDNAAPAGVYHVVNQGQASWFEFAQAIVSEVGLATPVDPIPASAYASAAARPPYSVLSTDKLTDLLGGGLPEWRDALRRYLISQGHRAASI